MPPAKQQRPSAGGDNKLSAIPPETNRTDKSRCHCCSWCSRSQDFVKHQQTNRSVAGSISPILCRPRQTVHKTYGYISYRLSLAQLLTGKSKKALGGYEKGTDRTRPANTTTKTVTPVTPEKVVKLNVLMLIISKLNNAVLAQKSPFRQKFLLLTKKK